MEDNATVQELAYIAGFIDGEGCIQANGDYLSLRVIVANTNRASLAFIQAVFGRAVCKRKMVGKTKAGRDFKQQWIWSLGGESAAKMSVDLLPYLIVKKQEAKLGIALALAKGHQRVDIAVELRLAKLQ